MSASPYPNDRIFASSKWSAKYCDRTKANEPPLLAPGLNTVYNAGMTRQEAGGLVFFTSDAMDTVHAFSTRVGGVSPAPYDSLNLGGSATDSRGNILENYTRFGKAAGFDWKRLVFTKQVHGSRVRVVGGRQSGEGLFGESQECDCLLTDTPGLPVAVFGADCVPILLYDPLRRAVGAVHAGWRGTAQGIAGAAVSAMGAAFGTDPRHLRAAIGPGIGPCCFETDADVPDALRNLGAGAGFSGLHDCIRQCGDGARFRVDLKAINAALLLKAGLLGENIDTCELCTSCNPGLFFSHRRNGANRGLQAAVIQVRELRDQEYGACAEVLL